MSFARRFMGRNAGIILRTACCAAVATFLCSVAVPPLPAQAPGGTAIPSATNQESGYLLSVDVNLVNVSVTVVDSSGRYIDTLTAKDFQVFEEGREQTIAFFSHDTRVPVSVGVLLDASASHKDKFAKQLDIVHQIAAGLAPDDEMLVVTFKSRAELRQKFTNSAAEIQTALRGLRPGGETAVFDAIALGLREMEEAKNQKRILLLVSDGFDTRSAINAAQAEELLNTSRVLVYAIGIEDEDTPATRKRRRYRIYDYLLNKLAVAGGGRLIRLYTGADDDLRALAGLVLGELHQQYTLSYYPASESENSGWRRIDIRVTRPSANVLGKTIQVARRPL